MSYRRDVEGEVILRGNMVDVKWHKSHEGYSHALGFKLRDERLLG